MTTPEPPIVEPYKPPPQWTRADLEAARAQRLHHPRAVHDLQHGLYVRFLRPEIAEDKRQDVFARGVAGSYAKSHLRAPRGPLQRGEES